MASSSCLKLLLPLLPTLLAVNPTWAQRDSLNQGTSLLDGDTLVSGNHRFVLGFFNLSSSSNRYLALKYDGVPDMVWIANRDNPVIDNTGSLKLSADGGLGIYRNNSQLIQQLWKPSTSEAVVSLLLDTGNLVVKDLRSDSIVWQSFDHPTDSMLPSMKVSLDLKTNQSRNLSSWKSEDDPSVGDTVYLLRRGPHESYEAYLMSLNGTIYYRPGPWNSVRFSGNMLQNLSRKSFRFFFTIRPDEEVSYSYEAMRDSTNVSRLVVTPKGAIIREVWDFQNQRWNELWTRPSRYCDFYNQCGPNGVCSNENCKCLQGFDPVYDGGIMVKLKECKRREKLPCGEQPVGFVEMKGMKLPDTANATVNRKMSLEGCKAACTSDCACTAYALDNSTGTGIGCIMWHGDLIDVRRMGSTELDILFLKSSEFSPTLMQKHERSGKRLAIGVIVLLALLGSLCIMTILLGAIYLWKTCNCPSETSSALPIYEYTSIKAATYEFSEDRIISSGALGPIFMGEMVDGKVAAITKPSVVPKHMVSSILDEAAAMSSLQEEHLLSLVGYSSRRETGDLARILSFRTRRMEMVLIYDYMHHARTLDSILFDGQERVRLKWKKRADIILGIAKCLNYLHVECQLKVIHGDLRAANIVLDEEMHPRILDFATARIFLGGNLQRPNGDVSIAMMAPEGRLSLGSDIFNFGVLIFEIIAGRRSMLDDRDENLLSMTWRLWKENNALGLLDSMITPETLDASDQVSRYIQIGLLCVQEHANDRPQMPDLISMLINDGERLLPEPKMPRLRYLAGR